MSNYVCNTTGSRSSQPQLFRHSAMQDLGSQSPQICAGKGDPLGSLKLTRLSIKLFSFQGETRFGFQVIYRNGLRACTPRSQLLQVPHYQTSKLHLPLRGIFTSEPGPLQGTSTLLTIRVMLLPLESSWSRVSFVLP